MRDQANHTGGDGMKDCTGRNRRIIEKRHSAGGWLRLLAISLLAIQAVACSKQSDSPKQSATPPEPKNQTYRMIGGHSVISLVSSDELEIREGGQNIVCKYTKQDGRLRVVVSEFGTTIAKYFNVTPQGLVDEDGDIYYEPATYEKVMAQIELNRVLWAAVEWDAATLIEVFIRKGAAVETRDNRRTALVMAIEEGKTNAVAALLRHRANPNQKVGNSGETAIWRAIANGNTATVELLLKHGANAGDRRDDGVTPLMFAASYGGGWGPQRKPEHDKIVSLLCDAKVDLNTQDNVGYSALSWSVRSGNLEAAKILVSAGADRTTGKDTGHDAFTLARRDERKIAAIRTQSERAERARLGERYRRILVGVWRDNESILTYNADGTKKVRFNNGRSETGTWSIEADMLTFDRRKGRIVELNESTWVLDINGTQWRATRVSDAELEAMQAQAEKARKMLVGTWRDSNRQHTQFTISADGTMSGKNVVDGKWLLDADIFTSSSNRRYQLLSIDAKSVVLKPLEGIWRDKLNLIRVE